MLNRFPSQVQEELKYYVYLYIDPRNSKPFYIGMGQGDRVFSHLNDRTECDKGRIIDEIRKLNLEPILEILKYGLTREEALLVEATAIELLDIELLANEVRGHGSREGARGRVEDICNELSGRPVQIEHSVILINIAQKFRYGMTPQALYDATRSAWIVDPARAPQYALAVFRRVVREVFEIADWLPGGSTMRHDDIDGRRVSVEGRYEFVGKVAMREVRERYVGRTIGEDIWKTGSQNPIRYIQP